MKITPLAVFGRVVYQVNLPKDETYKTMINNPNGTWVDGVYLYTLGETSIQIDSTGNVADHNRTKGWFSKTSPYGMLPNAGNITVTAVEETEWFCIQRDKNLTNFPEDISLSVLQTNDELPLPINSDVFLAKGNLTINGKEFIGPRQIRVRSSDVVCKATSESFLLFFPK